MMDLLTYGILTIELHCQETANKLGFPTGVCKFPFSLVNQVCWGRISSCVRGRKYHGCGEEYNVEKRGKGKQYDLHYNNKVVNTGINGMMKN